MFFHLLSYLPMLVVHLHKEYFHNFRGFWVGCCFFLNTVLLNKCSAFCMLLNRKTYSIPGALQRDPQNPMTWKKMLEGWSYRLSAAVSPRSGDRWYQHRTCPREGYAEVAVGTLSVVQEGLWSWQISVTRMWPITATERHYCISLQSATVPWAWCRSSCSPANQSSDCNRQSFAVTYYHKVNFLK